MSISKRREIDVDLYLVNEAKTKLVNSEEEINRVTSNLYKAVNNAAGDMQDDSVKIAFNVIASLLDKFKNDSNRLNVINDSFERYDLALNRLIGYSGISFGEVCASISAIDQFCAEINNSVSVLTTVLDSGIKRFETIKAEINMKISMEMEKLGIEKTKLEQAKYNYNEYKDSCFNDNLEYISDRDNVYSQDVSEAEHSIEMINLRIADLKTKLDMVDADYKNWTDRQNNLLERYKALVSKSMDFFESYKADIAAVSNVWK